MTTTDHVNQNDPVMHVHDLTKFYGKKRGIIDVAIEVGAGEVFGYLGPNGAGKTTTIRILMDFIRSDRGHARLFGLDTRKRSRDIHRRIGYLPGELTLYENLSVHDYLRYFAHLRGGVEANFIDELAERLDCELSRPIRSLSQGNKQKVGLIQAMMHKPELLILDEPTNGLDPLIRQAFYQLISEIKEQGRTVFLSSHVLPEVERVCDRVAIIRSGRIVAVERVADLRRRSLRQVEIHFDGSESVESDAFASIPGIRGLSVEGNTVKCQMAGEMDLLIKKAAQFRIHSLTSFRPGLEEIFLAYYGGGENAEQHLLQDTEG